MTRSPRSEPPQVITLSYNSGACCPWLDSAPLNGQGVSTVVKGAESSAQARNVKRRGEMVEPDASSI